jgi:hypothetical protein
LPKVPLPRPAQPLLKPPEIPRPVPKVPLPRPLRPKSATPEAKLKPRLQPVPKQTFRELFVENCGEKELAWQPPELPRSLPTAQLQPSILMQARAKWALPRPTCLLTGQGMGIGMGSDESDGKIKSKSTDVGGLATPDTGMGSPEDECIVNTQPSTPVDCLRFQSRSCCDSGDRMPTTPVECFRFQSSCGGDDGDDGGVGHSGHRLLRIPTTPKSLKGSMGMGGDANDDDGDGGCQTLAATDKGLPSTWRASTGTARGTKRKLEDDWSDTDN